MHSGGPGRGRVASGQDLAPGGGRGLGQPGRLLSCLPAESLGSQGLRLPAVTSGRPLLPQGCCRAAAGSSCWCLGVPAVTEAALVGVNAGPGPAAAGVRVGVRVAALGGCSTRSGRRRHCACAPGARGGGSRAARPRSCLLRPLSNLRQLSAHPAAAGGLTWHAPSKRGGAAPFPHRAGAQDPGADSRPPRKVAQVPTQRLRKTPALRDKCF